MPFVAVQSEGTLVPAISTPKTANISAMPLLRMQGITQTFPGVKALQNVDFTLDAGEVRALMGENGAGKSTLIKVLTGVYQPDSGSIELDGEAVRPTSPAHAQSLGISTVYQEVNLAPNLTVAESICLGSDGSLMRWGAMRERARVALSRLNLDVDVNRTLGDYPTAVQQLVAIARAIDRQAKVLVLDEPTSSLDQDECDRLFELMRKLRGEGMGIVFVTHFLDQVYAVSDSISVLRNGEKVGDWMTAELDRQALVSKMLGRDFAEASDERKARNDFDGNVLDVSNLGRKNYLHPITYSIRKGEVLGLAGLLGSGRTETMKLTFGGVSADTGRLFGSPAAAIKKGLGFCSEDRKTEAIFPGLSIKDNIAIVLQGKRGWFRPIPPNQLQKLSDEMIAKLNIKTPDGDKAIEQLSGGNQQKVVLSRWLVAEPQCLLLDEPTRGIDIGAKFEIRAMIRSLCQQGMAFLFTSSELEEVVGTSDRVLVLRDRRKVGELTGEEVTEAAVMTAIAGEGG